MCKRENTLFSFLEISLYSCGNTKKNIFSARVNPCGDCDQIIVYFNYTKSGWAKRSYKLGSASFPFKFSFYGSFFLNSLAKPLILSGWRKSFLFLTLFLSTDLRKKNPFLFPFHNMKGLRKKLRKCLKILSIILSKTLKIKENFRILRKTY